ncbi:MAG: cytochrome c peroxidase [Hyphomicrobiaceae bacterium]
MARVLVTVLASGLAMALVSGAAPRAADSSVGDAASATTGRLALWRSLLVRPPGSDAGVVSGPSPARAALGALLFADPRLSGPGDRSCASCHVPDRGFTDGLPRARGRAGPLARNTPTLWNVGDARRLNWDGGERDLAHHARRPIENREEMAGSLAIAAGRLAADAAMRERFAAAFPAAPTVAPGDIPVALAAYLGTLASPQTRFDRWAAGDDNALTGVEQEGLLLFVGRARCATCHAGWRFTDDRLHDIGRPAAAGRLVEVKTPTLRELRATAPYMHDGTLATLEAVVHHYSEGVVTRGTLSPNIARGLRLSDREIAALVAFLATLSSTPER